MSGEELLPPPTLSVDLEGLLQPISEASPCGESLRYEGTYDKIIEARRQDASDLPQGVWKTEPKLADWRECERLCIKALTSGTKDLQIALWLTEAWMMRHGFGGLRHGLELTLGLVQRFWDGLHPEIRDGDLDYRLAPLVWLNENLSLGVVRQPLMPALAHDDVPALSLADWQTAARLERLQATDEVAYQREVDEGRLTQAGFTEFASRAPKEALVALYGQLRAARAVATDLDAELDRVCGREAPSLRKLLTVLRDAERACETVVFPAAQLSWRQAKFGVVDDEADEPSGEVEQYDSGGEGPSAPVATAAAKGGTATLAPPTGAIQGRAQAYRLLAQVADYLQQIEPHSPTPYLIKRAVSWERKTLIQLMTELLRSPEEFAALHSLLGIPYRGFEE